MINRTTTFGKTIIASMLVASLCGSSALYGQDSLENQQQYEFFKDQKTYIKNPFELRDPFKRTVQKQTTKKSAFGGVIKGNTFTNVATIGETPLDKIEVVGVLLGSNRRAMVRIAGNQNDTFILKEGMKLGREGAELKAILPGGIVIVEKIRNVYDQDEYLETIIPISSK